MTKLDFVMGMGKPRRRVKLVYMNKVKDESKGYHEDCMQCRYTHINSKEFPCNDCRNIMHGSGEITYWEKKI